MLNFKYKIIAYFCCALVCAFLGLGLNKDNVYASSSSSCSYTSTFGHYYSFSGSNLILGFSGPSSVTLFTFSTTPISSYTYNEFSYDVDHVRTKSPNLYRTINGPYGLIYYIYALDSNNFTGGVRIASFTGLAINGLNGPYDFASALDSYFGSLAPEPSFDENLGVLDVTLRQLNLTGNNNQVHNQIYRTNWNSKSSTGFDVTQDGVKIEFKARLAYTYVNPQPPSIASSGDTISEMFSDYPQVDGSVQTFDFNYNDILNSVAGQRVMGAYNDDSVFSRGSIVRRFYLRILDSNSNTFGPWLEVYPKVSSGDFLPGDRGTGGSSIVDIDDDGNVTVVEELPDIDTDYGSGETVDDASNNADQHQQIVVPDPSDWDNIDFGGIASSIKSALSSFTSIVTNFMSLVSATLSFLPKWVVNFFALSIAIWCIMLIKRAIF